MSAYLIVDIEVVNEDLYAEYVEKVPVTVERYGGRYLARGGKIRVLSGDWNPQRIILIEFPSSEHVRRWLTSPQYAELARIRELSTKSRAVILEGLSR